MTPLSEHWSSMITSPALAKPPDRFMGCPSPSKIKRVSCAAVQVVC